MLDTGATTEKVIDVIETQTGLYVGDGIAPPEGGWSLGQPNTGEFVPYAVVAFMGARPRTPEVTMVKQESAWLAQFQLRYHGGSRAQVDWTGNACRRAVDELLKATVITDVYYEIVWVEWQSLGGVLRNDSTDPPIWAATDSLTLHTVKRGT